MYELQIPESQICIRPGNIVKLHKFDDECWVVNLGWFSYGGNRPMNGWYLTSTSRKDRVKPLNLPDLDDIYIVEIGEVKEDYKELDPKIKKLIHDLKLQVEELTKEVNQLNQELEAKDEVIAQKGQEILELQRQIRELQSQIDELESQHRLDADTIATLNAQVTAQAQIIAEKAAEISELTARVAELAEENELLIQQHQEDLATIQQQASTIQEQAQSIADLTTENETLTDENDRLTDENESLVAQHQQDVSTIETQSETIAQQGAQITELSGEVSELQGEVAEQAATITRQNTTIDELNRRVPPLETLDPINPSTQQVTYRPSGDNVGFNPFTVNGATCEGLGLNPAYYKAGEPCIDKVGSYAPPYGASKGGMYIMEETNGLPSKIVFRNLNNAGIMPFLSVSQKSYVNEIDFIDCSMTTISVGAFKDFSSLGRLNLPNTLTTILSDLYSGTFQGTGDGISTLTIPESVNSINGGYLFANTKFREIRLPQNAIETSGVPALFASGGTIEKINIPHGFTNLRVQMFTTVTNLKTIFIPNTITSASPAWIDNGGAKLEFVTLESGFNCSISLSKSTKYSHDTILSWFNALADRTGETAYTLTIGTTNLNKMTAEEKAIATNKNWNLA